MPDGPFPNINKYSEQFYQFLSIKAVVWVAVLVMCLMLVCTVLYCPHPSYLPLSLAVVLVLLWGSTKLMMVAASRTSKKAKKH